MSQKILLLILLGLFSLVVWQTGKRMQAYFQIGHEITAVQKEIKALKTKNTELLDLLNYTGSEAFLEREARLRFGLAKAGEKGVVILDPKEKQAAKERQSEEPKTNTRKWWDYFTRSL